MLFNSHEFILFLLIAFILSFIFPACFRWIVLLFASCFFYMSWGPAYIIVILIIVIVTYGCSNNIHSSGTKQQKKLWLGICILTIVGCLLVFKYFPFATRTLENLSLLGNKFGPPKYYDAAIPIGISFYALQALGYAIDVYRKNYTPERHFGKVFLFISFFPLILSGPIERARNLLSQFGDTPKLKTDNIVLGCKRILWGLFKKIVIADKLALIIDPIYETPYSHNGISLVAAILLFSVQIYCDFSGYCDIAIGAARLFGYRLSENFDRPYFAHSVQEFWRRWHMTLTSWLRDYLYMPLGGNRKSRLRWFLNIISVYLIAGLWHAAGWNFIVWGLLNGLIYLVGVTTKAWRQDMYHRIGIDRFTRTQRFIKPFITFTIISFCWVFFRVNELSTSMHIFRQIAIDIFSLTDLMKLHNYNLFSLLALANFSQIEIVTYFSFLLFFVMADGLGWVNRYLLIENQNKVTLHELLLLNFIILSLLLLGDGESRAFIYFQFK